MRTPPLIRTLYIQLHVHVHREYKTTPGMRKIDASISLLDLMIIKFFFFFFQALADYSTVLLLLHDSATEYSYKVYVNRGLLYLQLRDFANALLDFVEAEKCTNDERGNPAIHQAIGYCHHQ